MPASQHVPFVDDLQSSLFHVLLSHLRTRMPADHCMRLFRSVFFILVLRKQPVRDAWFLGRSPGVVMVVRITQDRQNRHHFVNSHLHQMPWVIDDVVE